MLTSHRDAVLADESPCLELAQVNVARLPAPLDSPETAKFVALLEPINGWSVCSGTDRRRRHSRSGRRSSQLDSTP